MPSLIADVALRARLGLDKSPVLTYLVPPALQALIAPGRLVWVPLRRRRVQGVVLRVAPAGGEATGLRELDALGDPEGYLTPVGLDLAQWVATTYRAPLYDALSLLLPPGVRQQAELTWRATPAGMLVDLGSLPEGERAILYYLRLHGEQRERDLRAALRGTDTELRTIYRALYERGLVASGTAQTPPGARPRTVRFAQLAIEPAQLGPTLEALRRAPRQAAVIEWMADQAGFALPSPAFPAEATGALNSPAYPRVGEPPASIADEASPVALPVSAIYAATGTNAALLRMLEQRGLIALEQREVRRDPLAGDDVVPDQPPVLSPDQRTAYEAIVTALEAPEGSAVFLLHGITGSGKTEVYLRTIARALRLGHQALVLVPEIALTTQLVRRFAARFAGQIAVLHSGLSLGERYDEWRRLRRGEARLAIGSRSAVFAPLPDLGLIVIDEEHELTYKHDAAPRYHARDCALHLATLTKSVVILGSATPAVESYHRATQGTYRLLELRERVSGLGPNAQARSAPLLLPPVRLIDMRHELQQGNRSIFSRVLQQSLIAAFERGEQCILFLNRRGAASFVMCRDCGYVVNCGVCSGPMTLHYEEDPPPSSVNERSSREAAQVAEPASVLICHSCGSRAAVPPVCPQCMSTRIRRFGVGTQRVAEAVAELLPAARVMRWDRDTASGKGAHGRMLDLLLRREVDILVGTQMIAKGLDLPFVALVGVVAADTGLHLPDFRSGERAFQLLTQVAGRAGRRTSGAEVVIQTYNPEHYALLAAQEHDYRAFFLQEIAYRREIGYPPFSRLVRFVYASSGEPAARRAAEQLAERLQNLITSQRRENWSLIGPAPAFIQQIRGRWRWHLIVRMPITPDANAVTRLLDDLGPAPGWMVDVDPVHVL
ncbi:primosomal protein N' [Candidatus Chloroploca sp. Khr17]|uniref:replication restart helicase PriA n=1 Tax=Candidatus Chloroploca sp. Khr17 TaxID=2496869 RepID=UPI00101DD04E|nr:primosomal protein N' [Candidatus Chloroploca sp. Khr17]